MSNYIPKVGEKCLFILNNLSAKEFEATYCGKFNATHWLMSKTEHLHYMDTDVTFKPLPTEEEKMVDDMVSILMASIPSYTCHACEDNVNARRDHVEVAKLLIKAGYRKVEPISRKDFVQTYNEYRYENDFYQSLLNKHIIVKDGE